MKTTVKKMMMAAFFAIALTACGKKNDSSTSPSTSTWTVGGANYTASTTVFSGNELLSIDKTNSQVSIGVLFNARPAAGTYTVVSSNIGSGQCTIQATGTGNNVYVSQGGGKVTITVNNGKLHASFSGVPMVNVSSQPSGTATGELSEQ